MVDILKAHTIADNFRVRVVADQKEQFLAGMVLAFNGRKATHFAISPYWGMIFFDYVSESEKDRKVHYVRVEDEYEIDREANAGRSSSDWLYRQLSGSFTEEYPIQGLPGGKASVMSCAKRAWEWLKTAEYKRFDEREFALLGFVDKHRLDPHGYIDDEDVSTHRGFEISTGDIWGHVGSHHGSICHVRPHWIWCGK